MSESNEMDDDVTLMIRTRWNYLQLAQCLLDAEPSWAGWRPAVIEQALALKARGHGIVLEITGDESRMATLSMVAVAPSGLRTVLDTLCEQKPGVAN